MNARQGFQGLPLPQLAQVEEELARRRSARAKESFHEFIKWSWTVLEPATPFMDNWHIGILAEHLEAIHSGQILRLIVNMPFRMLKSTICSVMFPAYEWTKKPSIQYLTGSYSKDLATRDAVNSRRIIESDRYRYAFGDSFHMTSDQNVKTRYENNKAGTRTITSTEAASTGFGGNRIIIDDPISAKMADSIPAIQGSIEWWKGTMATRFNNPKDDAALIVHQRLNENDLTGYLMREELGLWEHLVLPMRHDPLIISMTSLGYKDPRKIDGELIMPQRLDEKTVKGIEKSLGVYHTNAQLQQKPQSRGGVLFKRTDWKFYTVQPEVEETIISVDCSFKDLKSSDFVSITVWGIKGSAKYLRYRLCDRLGFAATCMAIKTIQAKYNDAIAVLIEDKANGTAVIETIKSTIPGVIAIEPEGGKYARASAVQPDHEAGNWYIPDPSIDPTIEQYLHTMGAFPNPSVPDDEVDSTTQAMNWHRQRTDTGGLAMYMRAQYEAQKAISNQMTK